MKLNIKCPKCNHKFTVYDVDEGIPRIYCNKCDEAYTSKIFDQIALNASMRSQLETVRKMQNGFKDFLGIK